jgi:benzoate-CoA ligase family protein
MSVPGAPVEPSGGLNLARLLLEARVAEGRGDRVALHTPEGAFTYAQVAARASALAAALRGAGVGRGDRVLWVLPDGIEFVAALFATWKLGAVGAMANPDLPARDHAALLAYTRPAALLATPGVLAGLAGSLSSSSLSCFVAGRVAMAEVPAARPLAPLLEPPAPPVPAVDTDARDPALWLFTSGSTGAPRAAVHAHGDFAFHVERYARGVLGMTAEDVVLAAPRLHFAYATGMALLFPFALGAAAVLFPEHPTPARLRELAARFAPTILVTVPTMTAKLLAEPAPATPFASLRFAVTAGEPLPLPQHRRWDEVMRVDLVDGLGSAEMFHVYLGNRPGEVRPGSVGRLVPGYEARVVGPDGLEVAPGEPGVLHVRGGSMMSGYHDDPERTAAALRDGWVVTGDVLRRDAEGWFFHQGRADDLLKVGGIYVSPLEVEDALREHAAVVDCAVVGVPDAEGLSKPVAHVVLRDGTVTGPSLWSALAAHCRQRLARYKVPRAFVAHAALPRNDRGKILRRALRDG